MQNLGSFLAQKEIENDLINTNLRDPEASRSWKITAPLRSLGDFLRSLNR